MATERERTAKSTFLPVAYSTHRPFIDLEPFLDTSAFDRIHEEICYGLCSVPISYTGGAHKWIDIVPAAFADDPYIDYGQVISRFSREEFARFVSLADNPDDFDLDRQEDYGFGEDAECPLSARQFLYLKYRYGVYFPWKVFVEFLEGDTDWTTKNLAHNRFHPHIEEAFPMTVSFVKSLPFKSIGRCNLLGLEANDHGTIHRDNYEHVSNPPVNDFITFCPAKNKRLFLWHETTQEKLFMNSRAYIFNDMNYHGVEADPFFRYSLRVDGIFTEDFRNALRKLG